MGPVTPEYAQQLVDAHDNGSIPIKDKGVLDNLRSIALATPVTPDAVPPKREFWEHQGPPGTYPQGGNYSGYSEPKPQPQGGEAATHSTLKDERMQQYAIPASTPPGSVATNPESIVSSSAPTTSYDVNAIANKYKDPSGIWLPNTPEEVKRTDRIYKEESNSEAIANGQPLPFPDIGISPAAPISSATIPAPAAPDGRARRAPPRPPVPRGGGAPPASPYKGLLDNLNKTREFYMGTAGTPGNDKNLSIEEQARMDKIDQAVNNGSITKEQGDKMRQAVQKDAIARTTIDAQPGYFDKKKASIDALGKLESDLARQEELTTKVYNNQATEDERQEQALMNSNLGLLQQKSKEINDFASKPPTYKEDSERYWKNLGTGSQIGFGLSAILGGAAQGFVGRKSTAFDQLNKSIDRDIESQRKTYEAASEKYRMQLLAKNQDYARAMQITGKAEDARRLLTLQHLNQYGRNMDILSKTTNSERVKLAADTAKLAFDKEKEDLRSQMEISQWQILHPKQSGGGGTTQAKADEQAAAEFGRRKDLKIPELNATLAEFDNFLGKANKDGSIPGVTTFQYSGPGAADKARLAAQQYGRIRQDYIHAMAGASATPSEIENIAKGVPEVPRNAEEVRAWRDTLARKRNSLEAEVAGGTTATGAATAAARREAAKAHTTQAAGPKYSKDR